MDHSISILSISYTAIEIRTGNFSVDASFDEAKCNGTHARLRHPATATWTVGLPQHASQGHVSGGAALQVGYRGFSLIAVCKLGC